MPEPRTFAASVLRGYLAELARESLLAEVRAKVGPRTAQAMDTPPFPLQFIDAAITDDILVAIAGLHGRERVRSVALAAARNRFGNTLQPIITNVIALLGRGPDALFARAGWIVKPIARGTHLTWASTGESSGTMEIRSDTPVADAVYAGWEGSLLFGFDLARVEGRILPARPLEGGAAAAVDIAW